MSIQCPHCQGTINVTITMTAGDPPPEKIQPAADHPNAVSPATPRDDGPKPKYRINTDIGMLRQCLHDVGLPVSANSSPMYNDKNLQSRRLKVDWMVEKERNWWNYNVDAYGTLTSRCQDAFGDRFIRAEKYGSGYVLYLAL